MYSDGSERPLKACLTPTELKFVRLIVDGKSDGEIARVHGTTISTIKNMNHRIYLKSGCASRLELANRYVFENLAEVRAEMGVVFG